MMSTPSVVRTMWGLFKYFAVPLSIVVPIAIIMILWDPFSELHPQVLWMFGLGCPVVLTVMYFRFRRCLRFLRKFGAWSRKQTAKNSIYNR